MKPDPSGAADWLKASLPHFVVAAYLQKGATPTPSMLLMVMAHAQAWEHEGGLACCASPFFKTQAPI